MFVLRDLGTCVFRTWFLSPEASRSNRIIKLDVFVDSGSYFGNPAGFCFMPFSLSLTCNCHVCHP